MAPKTLMAVWAFDAQGAQVRTCTSPSSTTSVAARARQSGQRRSGAGFLLPADGALAAAPLADAGGRTRSKDSGPKRTGAAGRLLFGFVIVTTASRKEQPCGRHEVPDSFEKVEARSGALGQQGLALIERVVRIEWIRHARHPTTAQSMCGLCAAHQAFCSAWLLIHVPSDSW
jgi:hypothetical protein